MRKLFQRLFLLNLIIVFLLIPAASLFSGSIDVTRPEISGWYNLIDAEISYVEEFLGDSYTDIESAAAGSLADRIIWYENGITLWFSNGRVVQLRIDSTLHGSVCGVGIGSSVSDIIRICGLPWIEAEGDLYYNLLWRSAPVRLRIIFKDSGLSGVYLYIVR